MKEEIDRREPAIQYRTLAQVFAWTGVLIGLTSPTIGWRLVGAIVGFGSAVHVYERGQKAQQKKDTRTR